MTFRIDGFGFTRGKWEFHFKGVEGKGVYGRVVVEPEGLVLEDAPEHERRLLVPGLTIADDASKQDASRILAKAFHDLGWGPEVNKNNNVVDSETFIYNGWR